jgi:hypothetical protein
MMSDYVDALIIGRHEEYDFGSYKRGYSYLREKGVLDKVDKLIFCNDSVIFQGRSLEPFFKREREKKDMAKLFQALRIEVNHEMEALREMLYSATELLRPGGRLSVITYHSLEDRMVKNVIKTGNAEGKLKQDFFGKIETPYRAVNRQVIIPDNDEQEKNPRSRSAKLRIAEKI